MRFHLLVPGGRWATVTARLVSLAKRCNSRFQRRTRAPLLPPQSAVMVRRRARGEGGGIGIDPDIDPALVGGDVVDAIGSDLAQTLDLKVVHPNPFRIAGPAQLATAILEIADQLFLLRVDRDRRFARGNRRLYLCIDVRELCIAVGMVGSFSRLAVGLTAVVQLAQQAPHELLAHGKTLPAQHLDDVALAATHPAQRRLRIAADRVLDQTFQGRRQSWLKLNGAFAPGSRTTNTLTNRVASRLQLGDPPIDRTAGDPGRRSHRRHAAVAQRQRLVRRKQPTPSLVEKRLNPHKLRAKAFSVDHSHNIMTPPAQGILYLDSFLAFLPSSRFDNFAADP